MKKLFTCFGLVALGVASGPSFAVDGEEKYLRLRVANAYSQCSAYYEVIVSVVVAEGEAVGVREAKLNKTAAAAMAQSMAEKLISFDVNDREKVKQLATSMTAANYTAALNEINSLAQNEPRQIASMLDQYKLGCAIAIRDPEAFARQVLSTQTSPNQAEHDFDPHAAVVAH